MENTICQKTGIKEKVLAALKQYAQECNIERVILFGSRARGDFKERSDIDLAVFGGNTDKFTILADEEAPTLLKFDIVNLGAAVEPELRAAIKEEGILLYEKI
ncbi:nucleotidyltransferase domain protein [Marvinbryantia formatexigens DSM 14469]|uniref:Nucleotidyltransferase domain protein n=1 Tax=Marvinbryantia formatexigens DSM 14469 TaxID=478749 RepID=C6LJR8_9FIRM|nr:nucleotidyltransferase domain-containing protein [Marvinbryantia formatexigens]EET59191.1 nucleotidyltransferase domain protein [Marvinbryantia formatexigens DSM 14469]UWO26202.1 nucleotidyltransferase domain-containing protein [Marvinbryantia formatexigens DSM 14469]SDG12815.1 Predicted nucleotidyltransferase [Marvinbryantia formatexigens]